MTQQLELPAATCDHRDGERSCAKEPGHYGCHTDGDKNWTKDMKLPPWALRRGRKKDDVA